MFCLPDYIKNYYNKNHDNLPNYRKKYNIKYRGETNDEYIKQKLKTDLNFEIAGSRRNRIYKAHKSFDSFECSH